MANSSMNRFYFLSVALCLFLFTVNAQQHTLPFYIGTYTGEGSEGVYLSRLDTLNGSLTSPVLVAKLSNPSYLAVSADNRFVWTVGEMNNTYLLSAFAIEKEYSLRFINSQNGEGSYSCYISELLNEKWLGAASYGSGLVTLYPLNADGSIGDMATVVKHWGKTPHAHCIVPDPMGKYSYSADLGIDKLLVYTIEDGKLTPHSEITLPKGTGPRHIAIDATGQWMAVADELVSRITLIKRNTTGAFAEIVSHTTMLPANYTKANAAADIHFSPDGRFLYASNRGHNSIVIYAFDKKTGTLQIVGWATEGINRPRNFSIDPTGKFLLVANQDGNDVVVFKRETQSGLLTLLPPKITVSHPVCLQFIHLKH
jgi:6-phosphogluconolactonase